MFGIDVVGQIPQLVQAAVRVQAAHGLIGRVNNRVQQLGCAVRAQATCCTSEGRQCVCVPFSGVREGRPIPQYLHVTLTQHRGRQGAWRGRTGGGRGAGVGHTHHGPVREASPDLDWAILGGLGQLVCCWVPSARGKLEAHGAEGACVRVGGGPVAADQRQPHQAREVMQGVMPGAPGPVQLTPEQADGGAILVVAHGLGQHEEQPVAATCGVVGGRAAQGGCGDEVGQLVRPCGGRVGQGHMARGVHVERHHVVDQVVARWDDRGLGHTGQGVAGLGRPQAAGLIVRVGLERDGEGVFQGDDDPGPGGVVGP